jgi:hypothetical protein
VDAYDDAVVARDVRGAPIPGGRKEIVDYLIVLGEHHLRRLLRQSYYNADRPLMSLERDAPRRRDVEPPSTGRVVAMPRLGGLHRRYGRVAA